MKAQHIYLADLLKRIEMIERFTVNGRAGFMESEMAQEAVIRCYEVIGEIVKRLDPQIIAPYSDVRWERIAGFRDFLIHRYDEVDITIVWDAVESHKDLLKAAVNTILRDLSEADSSEEK